MPMMLLQQQSTDQGEHAYDTSDGEEAEVHGWCRAATVVLTRRGSGDGTGASLGGTSGSRASVLRSIARQTRAVTSTVGHVLKKNKVS